LVLTLTAEFEYKYDENLLGDSEDRKHLDSLPETEREAVRDSVCCDSMWSSAVDTGEAIRRARGRQEALGD
jgi:hypothetical protein